MIRLVRVVVAGIAAVWSCWQVREYVREFNDHTEQQRRLP